MCDNVGKYNKSTVHKKCKSRILNTKKINTVSMETRVSITCRTFHHI